MKIAILKERRPDETRVAGSPETVKKFAELGADVVVEKGAGVKASLPDSAFTESGATIAASAKAALKGADVVLKVRAPMIASWMREWLIPQLSPPRMTVSGSAGHLTTGRSRSWPRTSIRCLDSRTLRRRP